MGCFFFPGGRLSAAGFLRNNRRITAEKIKLMFKPGQSGNPAGRKPGSKNKVNEALRSTISKFLEAKFSDIEKDFDNLRPSLRIKYYLELLQFGVPKMKELSIESDYESMTDAELDEIIYRLTKTANEKI